MTAMELREHAGYLADPVKMRAYRQAIRRSIADGARSFLDLGSGSGVLGLMAVTEGAELVYAVDSGSIIGPAAAVARSSGFGDGIVHIHGKSTEVDLSDHVGVAVCDQIGGFVHDAGVLGYFADARRRHLLPEGKLIPAGFRLFLAPATCCKVRDQIDLWRARPEQIDFSHFAELAVNTEHSIDASDCLLLAIGAEVAEILADHDQPFTGSGAVQIETGGSCDGLVGWFVADLGGDVSLTNHPADPGRMKRWCNFYPLSEAVQVEPGDRIMVDVDVRPLLHAVTWKVVLTDSAGSTKSSERHSTLLGQFLSPEDLHHRQANFVQATSLGGAIACALTLADGTRSIDEILATVRQEFGQNDAWGANDDTIRTIVRRFTESD